MANKNLFNSIQIKRAKKNKFDLTHDVKLSLNMGDLVPIMVQECVPGDYFKIGCDSLIRMAPMLSPVMHRLDVTMHYFFVPNRLLWSNWDEWIINPSSTHIPPTVNYDGGTYDGYPLLDYLGLPRPSSGQFVSALPFAAYQMIYNEYYRDQNLINEVNYKLSDGSNTLSGDLPILRKRAWQHDYFTSALPWAQKGPAVDIPLGQIEIPMLEVGINNGIGTSITGTPDGLNLSGFSEPLLPQDVLVSQGGINAEVEPTTINDLRRAFKLQEWLELAARGGTRMKEWLKTFFDVDAEDQRLQRPEYITGTKSPIIISEVLNATGEDGGLPQGNMAGHGMGVTSGQYGKYYCKEHGFIIGIMSVLPLPAYQQGIPKHYLKNDQFDYFWKQFAHIGEQEILNKELYVDHSDPNGIFGYTPRYSEYKYTPSRVAGDFKTSLNYWHLGRIFNSSPNLNKDFIEMNGHTESNQRIFAVTDGSDKLYCHVLNKVEAVRSMPKFGTPSF